MLRPIACLFFFFFNDTATTEIYTLSLHDALPISEMLGEKLNRMRQGVGVHHGSLPREERERTEKAFKNGERSEEHTSELQSQSNLVCRLLLEKKKKKKKLRAIHRRSNGGYRLHRI